MITALTARSERASRRMLFMMEKFREAFPGETPPPDPRKPLSSANFFFKLHFGSLQRSSAL
jgi:hypothetical protein